MLLGSVVEHDWRRPPDSLAATIDGHRLEGLAEAAVFHGVAGCVHLSLHGLPLPPATARTVEAAYHHGLKGHLRALGDLKRLAPVLDATGVPWLVVKGPVLSTGVYCRPDLRAYGDLDVVVPAESLAGVLGALLDAGCRLIDRNWVLLRESMQGEIHLRLPYGTAMDLHWHLLNEASLRDVFSIPMGELLERARPVDVDGIPLRTLDQTDTLVHLGLHSCLSGANRLVWLKDLERAIAMHPPSWDDVVRRARAWGAGLALATSLRQAGRLLAAEVPGDVGRELCPSRSWEALADLAFRLAPVERSVGFRSPARMLARSVRADARSSVAELSRHVLAGVVGSGRLRREPATDDVDPTSTGSMLHPAGDEHDLEAFLDRVAGRSRPPGH